MRSFLVLGHFQNNAIVSQFSFGYADELTQSQLHLMKQTRSYIQRTVYVNNEAINNLHQKKNKNQPQPKTLLCCFNHHFPKIQHFPLTEHVYSWV